MNATGAPPSQSEQPNSPEYQKYVREEAYYRRLIEAHHEEGQYLEWLNALENLKATDKTSAIASVEKSVLNAANNINALTNWGAALGKLHRYEEAESKFQQAVVLGPEEAHPSWEWGTLLFDQKRFAEAEPHFRQAITLETEYLEDAYDNWLATLEKLPQADQDKATSSLTQVITAKSDPAVSFIVWGKILAGRKRYPEAVEKYQQASRLAPDDPEIYEGWGSVLFQQNLLNEAEPVLRRAIACGAVKYSSAYSEWLSVLDRLSPQERDTALKSLEQAIAGRPGRADIYVALATELDLENKYELAIARYEQAITVDPEKKADLAEGYVSWGRWLAFRHQHKEAIDKFRHASRLSPASAAGAYFAWGKSLISLGEYRDAGRKFEDSLKISPNDSVYEMSGQILYLQCEYEEASRRFQKAIEINDRPGLFRQWLHNIARLATESQLKLTGELVTVLEGKNSKWQSASAYILWGQGLAERGKHDEAIQKYKKAVELTPTNREACLAWGDALLALKKYSGATEQYQRALDLWEEPKNVDYKLALVFLAQGAYQKCIDALVPLVPKFPSDNKVHQALGDCCFSLSRFQEAEVHYRRALEINTAWYDWYVLFPKWRSALQMLPEALQSAAIEAVEKVVKNVVDGNMWSARINWGLTLTTLNQSEEALQQFELVLENNTNLDEAYFQRANILAERRRYEEAQAEFRKAIDAEADSTYAYHNIAYFLKKQGKYTEARAAWEDTRRCYERRLPRAIAEADADRFYFYGAVLSDIWGDFDQADSIFKEGLEISPGHVPSLIYLGQNALDQCAETLSDSAFAEAAAQEYFRRAEQLLSKSREDSSTWLLRGDLFLKMERYPEAEKFLRKAGDADPSLSIHNQLGVLFSKKKNFKLAVQCFEKAVLGSPDDLDTRSNLAEALLNLPAIDRAQEEYEKILEITPEHIDTRIGLGQLYTKLGEAGDVDMFDVAIIHLTEAVRLAETKTGSKLLSRTNLAATHYALGYARVRLYEKAKTFADDAQLSEALDDFNACFKLDATHHKARRAVEKLTKRTKLLSPQSLIEKSGPWFILCASVLVFTLTQLGFWFKRPSWLNHSIDATLYSAMTLSSLTLTIVGFYLPRILKLKVAGIEIEKSSVEQISTISQPLGIGK